MAADPDFVAFALDLFSGLGDVRARAMFGGAGIYEGDAMFALLADERIYMKTDPDLSEAYAAAGAEPFVYETAKGPREVSGFMSLPDGALDDPDEALAWARRSLEPARAAAAKKRATRARKAAKARASG